MKRKKVKRASRVTVDSGVTIRIKGKQYSCRIINISASGILIAVFRPIPLNTLLQMGLHLPELREPLFVHGVVVRAGDRLGKTLIGIKFFKPSDAFQEAFLSWLEWYEATLAEKGFKRPAPERPRPRGALPGMPAQAEAPAGTTQQEASAAQQEAGAAQQEASAAQQAGELPAPRAPAPEQPARKKPSPDRPRPGKSKRGDLRLQGLNQMLGQLAGGARPRRPRKQ